MSNKDLLKLENEFRNELPKYKSKPEIKPIEKPDFIKRRVSDFLSKARDTCITTSKEVSDNSKGDEVQMDIERGDKQVEMEIYLTPIQQ